MARKARYRITESNIGGYCAEVWISGILPGEGYWRYVEGTGRPTVEESKQALNEVLNPKPKVTIDLGRM